MAEAIIREHSFAVSGAALKKAFRRLRPALPRRQKEYPALATFQVNNAVLLVGVPGAEVKTACSSTDQFTAHIPYTQFKLLMQDIFSNEEIVQFSFSRGQMTLRGMTITSPDITVETAPKRAARVTSAPQPAPAPPKPPRRTTSTPRPLDSAIELPMIGTYRMLRLYSDPALAANANPQALAARLKLERLLDRVGALLKPLGLRRKDVEELLDQRLGIGG